MAANGREDVVANFAKNVVRCAGMTLVLAAGLATVGCGMSSLTSGLNGGLFGGNKKSAPVQAVTEAQLLSAAKADFGGGSAAGADVAHGCPRFLVWSPGQHATNYTPGREGDALAVNYRSEITKTARECRIEAGRVSVKYGFSGRVLLGPAGKTQRVHLPVAVFVSDTSQQRIATDSVALDVDISIEDPIAYFSHVRTVTFAIPEGTRPGDFEVFVGFEQPGQATPAGPFGRS